MNGYVYAIESAGRIKIGHSMKPVARFSKVASDAPYPCTYLGAWPGSVADELDIHDKFHAIRSHGEWFAATEELLSFIAANVVVAQEATKKRTIVFDTDSPLTAWRKRSGLTQQQLAAALGICVAHVCHLEQGRNNPSLPIALKIKKLAGDAVPLESLLVEAAQ